MLEGHPQGERQGCRESVSSGAPHAQEDKLAISGHFSYIYPHSESARSGYFLRVMTHYIGNRYSQGHDKELHRPADAGSLRRRGQPLRKEGAAAVASEGAQAAGQVNAANSPEVLRIPPGNRLEKLRGGLQQYWSVRIDSQWCVIFQWEGQDAVNVQIVDYHD